MPYGLTITTPPVEEPVTLVEAKAHLRVDIEADDVFITNLIEAARIKYELETNLVLVNTTYTLFLDRFPLIIRPPKSPLFSVATIKNIDNDGNLQTVPAADYKVDNRTIPGRIEEAFDKTWPTTRDEVNAVEVEFVAGFGAAAADVPLDIKQALLLLVGHWYENREDSISATTIVKIPNGLRSLVFLRRVVEIK